MEASLKKVVELNIEDVLPNRFQPRIKFNEDAIVELSKSIKEHGVIQPIVVRPIGDKFEIIAGERRYKASCMAGLKTIPSIITDLNDKDSAEVALIENVQRENLTPIEEAISYKKILDMGYITQDALATKLGKTQSTVANKLRLLNLDDEVQEALLNEKISERHARSILKLSDKSKQREILNKIINERLTVRRTDEEIEKILSGSPIDSPVETPQKEPENKFKFINPLEVQEKSFEDEFVEEQEEDEPVKEEPEDLKPKKFFNILEESDSKEQQNDELFSFDKVFFKSPIEERNNAMMEELNEIENSINNSNTLEPLENATEEKQEEKQETKEESNDMTDEINIDDMEFIEEEPEEIQEPNVEEKQSPKLNNFKDVLEEIRTCGDKIEKAGFKIETEEYNLDGIYQIVFKIKNEE